MKAVALEREKMRQRERERLARGDKVQLRQTPKQYMKRIVDQFNLTKWVGQEQAREKLMQAGYRGNAPYVAYLFFRMVSPIVAFVITVFYLFVVLKTDQPPMIKLGMCLFAAFVGMQLPYIFLKNQIQKRQLSIRRAFPDALDLLLICVESGMSIEAAFRKVSQEIGSQSIPLAEELTLTTAELSYLQDRKVAYENLAKRTDLEGVKSVCVALQQSERYGTPLGQTLRVMAQENRDMRMSEAEKKAAALPPKLTVPMILFFLPVLFIVILGPGRDPRDGDPVAVCPNSGCHPGRAEGPTRDPVFRFCRYGSRLALRAAGMTAGVPVRLPGSTSRPGPPDRALPPPARECSSSGPERSSAGPPSCGADRRRSRPPRSGGRSARAIVSASWKRPCRPTTSARFCRTRLSVLPRAAARRSVSSARGRSFESA